MPESKLVGPSALGVLRVSVALTFTGTSQQPLGRGLPRAPGQGSEGPVGAAAPGGRGLTQVVPLGLGMFVDVFLCEAAKEDTVQAGVKPVQVDAADMTDARLRLKLRAEN